MEKSDNFSLSANMNFVYSNFNSNLEQIHFPRYESLCQRFTKSFNNQPNYIFRCGGLTSLSGESLPYFGYPSLFLTIEQEVLFAFSFSETENFFEVKHFESGYENYKFNKLPHDKFEDKKDSFYNLVLAGYKAALCEREDKKFVGIKLLVGGNLPKCCNLASSTALILGVCALTVFANKIIWKKDEILQRIAKYEKMISSNYKDWQAQALLEIKRNHAFFDKKLIELPETFGFILADSLAQRPKLMTRGTRMFKRLCEVRLCLVLVLIGLEMEKQIGKIKDFAELQRFLDYNEEDMLDLIKTHVEEKEYIVANIEKIIGKSIVEVIGDIPCFENVLAANFSFSLRKRGIYVIEELKLCNELAKLLEQKNINSSDKIKKIEEIIEKSDANSTEFFENQCNEIANLKKSLKKLGANATKMTGEGWGGCVFAIAEQKKIASISEELIKDFYLDKENGLMLWDDIKMYICANFYPTPPALAGIDPNYEIWF